MLSEASAHFTALTVVELDSLTERLELMLTLECTETETDELTDTELEVEMLTLDVANPCSTSKYSTTGLAHLAIASGCIS